MDNKFHGVKVSEDKLNQARVLYYDTYKRFPNNQELVNFAMEFFNASFIAVHTDTKRGKK
jgi:hypothetical protein